jgi:hypothetical protein
MGRLIDADAFERSVMCSDAEDMQDVIYALRDYPTAYDPDKVVEQLEEVEKIMTSPVNKDCFGEECKASDCMVCLISKAIEIVKGGGVDVN